MPNWCDCDLTIEGPKERLEAFLCEVASEGSLFDFERMIPYPERFRELDRLAAEWWKKAPEERTDPCPKDGFNQGGYEWRVAHWGTKWPARGVELDRDEWPDDAEAHGRVSFHFATAWTPPVPVIVRTAERFSELRFDLRYFECGMAFQGVMRCDSGAVRRHEEWPYSGTRGG